MSDKPTDRFGYSMDETELVKASLLSVMGKLGSYLDDVVVVGGLVPLLLIDLQKDRDKSEATHPGTNDLDLGLALAVLDEERYSEISELLRRERFGPDQNENGNETVQRWVSPEGMKLDFLIPPGDPEMAANRIHKLEGDFGAIVTDGLDLAFDEKVLVEVNGTNLSGDRATRKVPVCGPGAFLVLKALAFEDRSENKDAFDLVYVLSGYSRGKQEIASRLAEHAESDGLVVSNGLAALSRSFESEAHVGPRSVARFELGDSEWTSAHDEIAADAFGHVRDLLDEIDSANLEQS